MRTGDAVLGQPAHVIGRAAHSRVYFGPTLASVVLVSLLSESRDVRDQISSCCHGVLHPHLFPIYLFAQHVEINTYPKEYRANNSNKLPLISNKALYYNMS